MVKQHATPIAERAIDLAYAAMSASELTYRAMCELMSMADAEWLPLEREARRRWERDDPRGYRRYVEERKRRTASGRRPDAA